MPKEPRTELSATAELVASHRTAESLKPANERICYDPYAMHFLSPETLEIVKDPVKLKAMEELAGPLAVAMGASLRARVRYFDDFVKKSIHEGIEQLVMLGAGYDTRAYRIEGLQGKVKVFEVDHPYIQRFKKEKIREIFGSLPEHVVYVPVDLETPKLSQSLFNAGYSSLKKTLFVMEGLVSYLTPQCVDEILSFITENSVKGSAIIFDYHDESVVKGTCGVGKILHTYLEQIGETFQFGIPEGKIEEFLKKRGFSDIINVTSEDYKEKYFKGINEKRKVCDQVNFVHAVVSAPSELTVQ